MEFPDHFTNGIRALVVILTVPAVFRRRYGILLQAAVTLVFTFLPGLLSVWGVNLGPFTNVLYQTVLLLAPFLGMGYKFYDWLAWWDRMVHLLSGVLYFCFGVALAEKLIRAEPAGVMVFAVSFSLALQTVSEVVEFAVDSLAHTDHQRWQKHSSANNHQPGRALHPPGLVDTMIDTVFGLAGALAACAGYWLYLNW